MWEAIRRGVDGHTILGTSGFLATITLSQVDIVVSCIVGLTTASYMGIKTVREFRKWRKETQQDQ